MPEVQAADPRLRMRAIATIVAIVVVAIIVYLVLAGPIDQLQNVPRAEARATLARILGWSVLAVGVLVAGFGGYLWRLGASIRRAGRFPPPGAGVIRDTPVLTGDAAQRRGRIARWLGAALIVLSFVLVIAVWHLTRLLGG